MIKIDNSPIEQICSNYADDVSKMKRRIYRDNQFLIYIFNERNFRDIISCPASSLYKEVNQFKERFPDIDYKTDKWIDFKNYMVRQYEKVRNEYLQIVLDSLNLRVCPYCNRQYIFSADGGRKVSAQFDHFYNKTEHPYLALSFYNLIPCCPTCNKAKGGEHIEINPYIEGFGDRGRIQIDSLLNCILYDADWTVKIDSDDRCRTNIHAFALDELYKKHRDYAYEIIMKSIANQEGYFNGLRAVFQNMGITNEVIERILWGNYLDERHLSSRPLSKMTVDILKQLKDVKENG